MNTTLRSILIAGGLIALQPMAAAVSNGIVPADGLVYHPSTGQEITAWKFVGHFVGTANCSAVQIHANWILHTAHCYRPDDSFVNHLTSAGVPFTSCLPHPQYRDNSGGKYDLALCRLATPVGSASTFAPLVVAPLALQPDETGSSDAKEKIYQARPYLAKWGHVMVHGFGEGVNGLGITDFSGNPLGTDPAKGPLNPFTFPAGVGNDSGGAVYWLSPSSSEPALLGVMAFGGPAFHGAVLLTDDTIGWIRDTLAAGGDTNLRTLTTQQHFSGPSGPAVQELQSPPRIASINGSRSHFNVSWSTPTNSAPISGFLVTMGKGDGALELQTSISQGQGNLTVLSGVASGHHTLCVRPEGASGAALPGFLSFITTSTATPPSFVYQTPNCITFDTLLPAPAALTGLSSTKTVMGSQVKVAFAWQAAAGASYYKLTQTITYPSGPFRKSDIEASSPIHTVMVSKGSTICLTAQPFNGIGIPAAAASNCVLAQ